MDLIRRIRRLLFATTPRPRDRLATLATLAIVAAAVMSGLVHLSLGSPLFTLNGLGYLGNGLALLSTLLIPGLRYRVRSYLAGWLALYATLTIAGYLLEGAPRSFAAFLALFAEGGIILGAIVLWGAYRSAYERHVRPHDEPREHWVSAPSFAPFTIAVIAGGLIFFLGANPWSGIDCERSEDPSLSLAACDLLFDRPELVITADVSATLRFENRVRVPHNIALHAGDAERVGEELWRGELIEGPRVVEYVIPPLPAGRYAFVCSIHPTMVGTLLVEPLSSRSDRRRASLR